MGRIYQELSANYGLISYPNTEIAELTKHNSNVVENRILNGLISTSTNRRLSRRYNNNTTSAKIRFDRIKKRRGRFDYKNFDDVFEIVKQIDIDNSTLDHKFHGDQAINCLTNYIVNSNKFENIIKSSDKNAACYLVDDMRNILRTAGLRGSRNRKYNPRSLPSKVCKYFSEFECNNDLFYIDDSVVRSCIPMYMEYLCKIKITKANVDASSYGQLYSWLEQIHLKANGKITKSELDHILWFVYKK